MTTITWSSSWTPCSLLRSKFDSDRHVFKPSQGILRLVQLASTDRRCRFSTSNLWEPYTNEKVKCWFFFCLDFVLVFHSDSKWDCFFVYQPTIKTDRNIVNCLSMHFYLSKTLYNFLFLDGKKPKESCDNKIIQLYA